MSNQNHPSGEFRVQHGRGCFSIAVLCFFGCVLVVSSVSCGFGSYMVASLFGTKSIGSSVAGAVAAMVMICANFPGGVAALICLHPGRATDGLRGTAALGMAVMTLFIHGASIAFVAFIAAISAAYLFWHFEPVFAALTGAIVFPVVGLVSGAGLCMQAADNSGE